MQMERLSREPRQRRSHFKSQSQRDLATSLFVVRAPAHKGSAATARLVGVNGTGRFNSLQYSLIVLVPNCSSFFLIISLGLRPSSFQTMPARAIGNTSQGFSVAA